MSSFAIYAIGVVIIICGLAYAATLAHVHTQWIFGGVILVLGAGLIGAVNDTRKRDYRTGLQNRTTEQN